MTEHDQKQLGKTLWNIADQLRGAMNADDFRDYMLAFLFLRYLSDNYEAAAKRELGKDYPDPNAVGNGGRSPLSVWYANNPDDVAAFEKQMRRKAHYVIKPEHLWTNIAHLARTQNGELLHTLQAGFKYIENESFESTFQGLFSEINLASDKLGREVRRDATPSSARSSRGSQRVWRSSPRTLTRSGTPTSTCSASSPPGRARRRASSIRRSGSRDILSAIVTLDGQEPATGPRKRLESVLDFACGSGSLLLNVRNAHGAARRSARSTGRRRTSRPTTSRA